MDDEDDGQAAEAQEVARAATAKAMEQRLNADDTLRKPLHIREFLLIFAQILEREHNDSIVFGREQVRISQ